MAIVISFINLKGGVGKTTTTVAVAEMLAGVFHRKVLVIDLDPQTNATLMLIGEERWEELNENHYTLAQLFLDAIDPEHRKFHFSKTLQYQVSNVKDLESLDLLPSSLDLIDVQDRLATIPAGRFYAANPINILRRGIRPIINQYDYILIDCPPNLSIVTLNGLRISHGYIIPTIPDILSTYGIPQITKTVSDFADTIAEPIEPLGIVISKYNAGMTLHDRVIKDLRRYSKDAPVFETQIPHKQQIAETVEFDNPNKFSTLRQKWGYAGQFEQYLNLTKEIRIAVSQLLRAKHSGSYPQT
ncbi:MULTISPECIES: ParA family protein [unclassified Coleofasciculus]|nr:MULTISPECIES: AAA family ATPase [unclassified Coleofasciculus]MBE9129798.1 ParA family protein [Coleofasciculus sp. LEGE 07081]MBE9152253.1 ParA family protein [Coleofasciculus sp. LEGE 07092]